MSMDNAPAAGQGGPNATTQTSPGSPIDASAPASHSRMRSHPDDAYRRFALEELATQLARSSALLAHCEEIAKTALDDQLGPVRAAARLISANAQIAKAFAQMAMVERRSRTIVETVQELDPEIAGLNSILTSPQKRSPEQREKIRDALERGLLQFLNEQKQDRERSEDLAVGSSI